MTDTPLVLDPPRCWTDISTLYPRVWDMLTPRYSPKRRALDSPLCLS
jgi:hypothetical protein